MRRFLAATVLLLVPAAASAQQSLNFSIGGFSPVAADARGNDDVLVNDQRFLAFNVADFGGVTVGADWLIALGDNFDAGLGIGFYQRTTPGVDRFNEFIGTGDPIVANLKLRVVPMTATFRFLPLGHHNGVQPYIGGGVGVFAWRYSEQGDFVADDNVTILLNRTYVGSGTSAGPVVLGGVRFPIGSVGVGGEIKWHSAEGTLPTDQGFAGTRINLGGLTYSFTVNFRF
jgi:hypothetical protein